MIRVLLALVLIGLAQPGAPACRLALALGLDVSGSVSREEYMLQRNGLAAALLHPDVSQAFLRHPGAHVRVAVYEWSGTEHQRVLIGWTEVSAQPVLERLAARLITDGSDADGPRRRDLSTALGTAMQSGAAMLSLQPDCRAHTLDISGDGKQNTGPHPRDVRAGLSSRSLTINALVIGADDPQAGDLRMVEMSELVAYFKAWVLMGPGAFVETALDFEDFENAMIRKLLREMESPVLSMAD